MPHRRGLTEQAVDAACRTLRLPTIRSRFEETAGGAEREQRSYHGFLAELLMAERNDRARRCIKATRFPREKYLRTFDFDANPTINPAMIRLLAKCDRVRKGIPLCSISGSGAGKSNLFIALGTEAAMVGFQVKYNLDTRLVKELVEAADDRISTETIALYGRIDLLRIDERVYGFGQTRRRTIVSGVDRTRGKNSVAIASNDSIGSRMKRSMVRGCTPPSSTDLPSAATSSKPAPTPTVSPTPKPPPSPAPNNRLRDIERYEVVSA